MKTKKTKPTWEKITLEELVKAARKAGGTVRVSLTPVESLPIHERPFLQCLRDTAKAMCPGNMNPDWVRAYEAMADAADRLDAMRARLEVPPPGGWTNAELSDRRENNER